MEKCKILNCNNNHVAKGLCWNHYQSKRRKDNRVSENKYQREYKQSDKAINAYLIKTYKITLEDYNELLNKQDNNCIGCGRHKSEFNKRFAVDHNHKTGKVRGLLCSECNLIIKWESSSILRKLADYIDKDGNM